MGAENAETEELVITLPTDETRQWQLCEKLAEYKKRRHPYRAPESQMDVICKIAVLERLCEGKVNTCELSRDMVKNYGSGFNADDFNNACMVIQDYRETGGQNVRGGSGLPTPPMDSK